MIVRFHFLHIPFEAFEFSLPSDTDHPSLVLPRPVWKHTRKSS